LRIYQAGKWSETELPVKSGCVSALLNSADGKLWVAIERQLWQFDEDQEQWKQFSPPALNQATFPGFAHGDIKELLAAPDGSLWVMFELCGQPGCDSRQILYQIENGSWTSVAVSSFLQPPLLLFDQDSTLWAFRPGEISKLSNKSFQLQASMDWISAATDSDGEIWVLSGELNKELTLWQYQP
jgi:ligand-binding sensor domain-containing protein